MKFCVALFLLLGACGDDVSRLFDAASGPSSGSGEPPSHAVLILSLDAALASGGTGPYASGCAAGQLSWQDVSGTNTAANLTGFSSSDCAGAPADQRLSDRRRDRDAAVAGIRLERADQLVFGEHAVAVADADDAADACAAVRRRGHDRRCRKLRLEPGNAPLELRLLFQDVLKRRIVRQVAVLTCLPQALGGEGGRHGDAAAAGGLRCGNAAQGVLDDDTACRVDSATAGGRQVDIRRGFFGLHVVAAQDGGKQLLRYFRRPQVHAHLYKIGGAGQRAEEAFGLQTPEQG